MASLFSVVLGYSLLPYVAVDDENFLKIFSKLHSTKNYFYFSLIDSYGLDFLYILFLKLSDIISFILAMRIIFKFIGQAVGLFLLRNRFDRSEFPFKMWLYPIPIILSIAIWVFVFVSTGKFALWGSLIAATGIGVYYITEHF